LKNFEEPVSADVAAGLELLARSRPLWPIDAGEWSRALASVRAFAAGWDGLAGAAGWTSLQLYGLHRRAPYARLTGMGAAWLVARSGHNAIAVTADAAGGDARTAKAEATEFLRAVLADNPQPAAEVNRMAREQGLTAKVIRSARGAGSSASGPPLRSRCNRCCTARGNRVTRTKARMPLISFVLLASALRGWPLGPSRRQEDAGGAKRARGA
jgi:hypothetical protein